MQYMTNGRYQRADHQAIVNGEHDRMSVAMFFHAENEAKIYPLKVKEGEKPLLEEPITYAEMKRRHTNLYIERTRITKLSEKENWSLEELDRKLAELEQGTNA
uniref:Isopenicillin N synthase-like Fe(2+) 2OG dioxygenase domain-containing protein n=1 Tax=Opuntia streptacantha TaxID=393608 RepID=A0A7C8ZHY7_OPUST